MSSDDDLDLSIDLDLPPIQYIPPPELPELAPNSGDNDEPDWPPIELVNTNNVTSDESDVCSGLMDMEEVQRLKAARKPRKPRSKTAKDKTAKKRKRKDVDSGHKSEASIPTEEAGNRVEDGNGQYGPPEFDDYVGFDPTEHSFGYDLDFGDGFGEIGYDDDLPVDGPNEYQEQVIVTEEQEYWSCLRNTQARDGVVRLTDSDFVMAQWNAHQQSLNVSRCRDSAA